MNSPRRKSKIDMRGLPLQLASAMATLLVAGAAPAARRAAIAGRSGRASAAVMPGPQPRVVEHAQQDRVVLGQERELEVVVEQRRPRLRAVVRQPHRLRHLLVHAGEPGQRRMLGADQHDDRGVDRRARRLGEGVGGAEGVERRVAQRRHHRRREVRVERARPGRRRRSRSALVMNSTRKFTSEPWPSAMSSAGQLRQPAGEGGDVGAVAGGVLGRGRGAGHHRHPHRPVPAPQQRRRLGVHEAAAEVDVLVVERDALEVAHEVVGRCRARRPARSSRRIRPLAVRSPSTEA